MQTGGKPASLGRFEKPALLLLTSLLEGPRHAYAIVKHVEAVSGVRLAPGTLYATLTRLEARGLIQAVPSDDRRRPYRLTSAGAALISARLERMGSTAGTGLEGQIGAGVTAKAGFTPAVWVVTSQRLPAVTLRKGAGGETCFPRMKRLARA